MYACMHVLYVYILVIYQCDFTTCIEHRRVKKKQKIHTKRCSMYMEYLLYLYHRLKANDKCTCIPYSMEHLGYRST